MADIDNKTYAHWEWPAIPWQDYAVVPTGRNDLQKCPCCGNPSTTVWGEVQLKESTYGIYYASWTPGVSDDGAAFDLIVGPWGDDIGAEQRAAVALMYQIVNGQCSFMIIDATKRRLADSDLVGRVLKREDFVRTPLATHVFSLVDAVFVRAPELSEVREWNNDR